MIECPKHFSKQSSKSRSNIHIALSLNKPLYWRPSAFSIYPNVGYLLYLGSVPIINLSLKRSLQSMHQPPQQSACWKTLSSHLSALGCLLSNRPSDFCGGGGVSPRSVLMHGVESPLPSSLFGLETTRCLYTFITSFCMGHVAAPTFLHVAVCFPTGRLILRDAPPQGQFRCMGSKPLPAIFIVWARNIQTSICIGSVPYLS